MKYADSVIDEVLSRNNIVEIIGEQVRLRRSGSNYIGLCPFHSEKTPSFSVNDRKQVYYCFGCHEGGNAITFMMRYHNYTFSEALHYLADRAGMTLPEEEFSAEQRAAAERRSSMLSAMKQAAGFYYYRLRTDVGAPGLRYLRSRGLSDETIRRFGLGYADQFGDSLYRYLKSKDMDDDILMETGLFRFEEKTGVSDRFWNRVMYPISDERGRVIGFGGRVMGEGKPKYLNSPEGALFNKRRHLYALNYARTTREHCMILCEGYMDVITMHQAGFTNTVASLGTALTPEQCQLLRRFTGEAVLMYDSDEAGMNAALRAIPLLEEAGLRSRVVSLSPHKDPDEFIRAEGADALRERLASADSSLLFEIGRLADLYRRSDPQEWTTFQHKAAERLSRIGDELERENYIPAVCARYGIPEDAMRRLVRRLSVAGTPAEKYRKPASGRAAPGEQGADGTLASQMLMLHFLAAYPAAYSVTKDIVGPQDFRDPRCAKIASALYGQLAEGRVSESGIISGFDDPEDERFAASVFHTEISAGNSAELDRSFTETVLALLREGARADALLAAETGEMEALRDSVRRKQLAEKIRMGKPLHLPYEGE